MSLVRDGSPTAPGYGSEPGGQPDDDRAATATRPASSAPSVTEPAPSAAAEEPAPLTPEAAGPGRRSDPQARRSPIWTELAVIAFLGWIYDWLQNLAPLRKQLALHHGIDILSLERSLHISVERPLDHWLIHHYWLAYISSDFYDNAIFGVTFGLAAWLWWRRPDIYRPLRNDLVVANLIGFSVFWAFPVAPPRMLPGFTDVVEKVGGLGSWHSLLISHADQLAAMPSMHLAWAVWCSLVVWRAARSRRARAGALVFGIAYPVSTAMDVLSTANHYVLDVLAGAATLAVAALLVEAVVPWARSAWRSRSAVYQRSWTSGRTSSS